MVIDNNSDITELQAGIDRVVQWSECWQLNMAICKCQYMRVGLKKVLDPVTYFVADSPLCSTELCVDLSDVNKDLGPKAKAKAKDFGPKAKAKDLRCQSQ